MSQPSTSSRARRASDVSSAGRVSARGDVRYRGQTAQLPQPRQEEVSDATAQRLTELFLAFPAAAVDGVPWAVLARRYEQRHGAALAPAAAALLRGTGHIADASDPKNPLLAVDDAVAVTPHPELLGHWPALYQMLCAIVVSHGTVDGQGEGAETGAAGHERTGNALLLSQLKPLLQAHWDTGFDESSLAYLREDGAYVKLKKMKHLVSALVQWRGQRVAWRAVSGSPPSAIDEAVALRLEVAVSRHHNDLLLRCFGADGNTQDHTHLPRVGIPRLLTADCKESESTEAVSSTTPVPEAPHVVDLQMHAEMAKELERLRQENAQLRCKSEVLEKHFGLGCDDLVFDNPFEPPPEAQPSRCSLWVSLSSPAASTIAPSLLGSGTGTPSLGSGATTPTSAAWASSAGAGSGCATPMGAAVAVTPMWFCGNFSLGFGDRVTIPNGIVKQARAIFERAPGMATPRAPLPPPVLGRR